ncbi:MAG: DNA polymerase III subunit [Verrucomicrobiales bacterium]|nr:DNA polymerase III subunit [Verrucomicrobiales bacterium]
MSLAQFPEQRQSVDLLQRSLDRGRLAHAYLFSGTLPGVLEAVARTLAKTLNCQQPSERGAAGIPLDACDQCLSCRKIESDNHPDVRWVRPESKTRIITIEQIRDLMQAINLKPTEAAYKVEVIAGADRLNVQAANAFLKTLEEPPARSVIILLTTEPQRILETIVSRCLRLTFAGEPAFATGLSGTWMANLGEMAAREPKGLLSRYRLLGTLVGRLSQLKAEIEKRVAQRSPLERYDDIEPKLRDRWEDELTAAIEAEYRRQRAEVLGALHWWLRDVWLQTASFGRELMAFPSLVEVSRTVARRLSFEEATENLRVMEDLQQILATNVQEALALEVGLLKLKL